MESYGTDFSLVLGVSWGIIKLPPTNLQAFLGSPRHHCQCRAAMCSITAPEVECDITPHCDTVILFVHLGFPWKATKCDLDCDLLTGTKLQTESLFRAGANYFEHF